jgi:hypothetical protein
VSVVSLEALRLSQQIPGLDAEDFTRAVAAPIDPPADLALEVWPEDDIIAAYKLTSWYIRETDQPMEQAALYVARRFGLSFQHAWDQVECSYEEYNSTYSHN